MSSLKKKQKCDRIKMRKSYVNGAYRDDTPIGKLMYDFSCPTPSEMNYSVLADRTRFFKESEKGVAVMCKILEEMCEEVYKETREEDKKISSSVCWKKENTPWRKLWICPASPRRRYNSYLCEIPH